MKWAERFPLNKKEVSFELPRLRTNYKRTNYNFELYDLIKLLCDVSGQEKFIPCFLQVLPAYEKYLRPLLKGEITSKL